MKPLLALAAAALLAAPAQAAPADSATASVTPAHAGRVATLVVKLHTELQCGALHPGRGVLNLPQRMVVPASPVVKLDQTATANVAVAGHTLSFTIPHRSGMTCMVIGPGTVTITVAGLRNPGAGRYTVHATANGRTFAATFAVSA
jgi:hypothetical protein